VDVTQNGHVRVVKQGTKKEGLYEVKPKVLALVDLEGGLEVRRAGAGLGPVDLDVETEADVRERVFGIAIAFRPHISQH
jgi:hypothetical protein